MGENNDSQTARIYLYLYRNCGTHLLLQIINASSPFLHNPFCNPQASGVTVSDICKTTYEEIKKDKKHRYVIFYIRDEKQIDVEVVGNRDAEYDSFLEDIQKGGTGECR